MSRFKESSPPLPHPKVFQLGYFFVQKNKLTKKNNVKIKESSPPLPHPQVFQLGPFLFVFLQNKLKQM